MSAVAMISIAAFAAAAYAMGQIYDLSWDGQWYHQEGIIRLAQGWNPLTEFAAPDTYATELFLKSYAKGPWMLAASVYTLTGAIETGKAFNLVLILISGGVAYAALAATPQIPWHSRAALAALAALNPISICQMFSFYVDGQLASLFVCSIGLLYLALRTQDHTIASGLIASLTLLCATKVSGAIFAVIILGGVGIWLLAYRAGAQLRYLIRIGSIALATTLLAGANPYITNTIAHGTPLYPALGSSIDLMQGQRPGGFDAMPSAQRLMISLLADPANIKAPAQATLKWPFQLGTNPMAFATFDTKVAGFGPFFGGGLFLATLALIALIRARQPGAHHYGIGVALLALSVMSHPEAWWARFAPQLWLVPLCVAACCLGARRRGFVYVGASIVLIMAINLWVAGSHHIPSVLQRSADLHQRLAQLSRSRQRYEVEIHVFASHLVRLREAGIRFSQVERVQCVAPLVLERGPAWSTRICPSEAQTP